MDSTHGRRAAPLVRRLVLGSLSVVVTLAALEGVARHLDAPLPVAVGRQGAAMSGEFEPDPEALWRLRAGVRVVDPTLTAWETAWGVPPDDAGEVPMNAGGFRDDEPDAAPLPGHLRVLLLGDSSAWGWGVRRRDTFAALLEHAGPPGIAASPATDSGVEVLNLAVPGYSTYQSLVTLGRSLDLHPDGMIVYNMLSDYLPAEGPGRDDLWYRGRSPGEPRWWDLFVLPRMIARVRFPADTTTTTSRVTYDHYLINLERMVAIAQRAGMWTIFVVPPVRSDVDASFRPADLDYVVDSEALAARARAFLTVPQPPGKDAPEWCHRLAMALVAWDNRAPLVDGPRLFRAHLLADPQGFRGRDELFVDNVHPGPRGHALLADALRPLLASRQGGHP